MDYKLKRTGLLLVMAAVMLILPGRAIALPAGNNVMAPPEVYSLAGELAARGDYARAATEYARYIAFARHHPAGSFPMLAEAMFNYANALKENGEDDQALHAFAEFGASYPKSDKIPISLLLIGGIYEKASNAEEAERRYKELLKLDPDGPLADRARLRLAWLNLRLGSDNEALQWLQQVRSRIYQSDTGSIISIIRKMKAAPRKSPRTAGLLSAVLPGAGHAYLGRGRDALFGFLSNALFTAAALESFDNNETALGVIMSVLEGGWYSGTIYSSVSLTHRYNRKMRDSYLRRIQPIITVNSRNRTVVAGIMTTWQF